MAAIPAPVRRPDGVTATVVSCWDGAEVASVSQCQCPSVDDGLMKCSGWGVGGVDPIRTVVGRTQPDILLSPPPVTPTTRTDDAIGGYCLPHPPPPLPLPSRPPPARPSSWLPPFQFLLE